MQQYPPFADGADEFILAVSINPEDGSFDWSRTEFGVCSGIHTLREPGDRVVSRLGPFDAFEVLSSEYAPDRSRIEIKGLGKDGSFRHWSIVSLEVALQDDGSVVFSKQERGSDGATPSKSYRIRLRKRTDYAKSASVDSRLAGRWAVPGTDTGAAVIIREDGTFDWTGSWEGMLGGWYQLERQGDRSLDRKVGSCESEVLSAVYSDEESRLIIRMRNKADQAEKTLETFEMRAELEGEDSIMLSCSIRPAAGEAQEFNTMLCRAIGERRSVEMYSTLLHVASSDQEE